MSVSEFLAMGGYAGYVWPAFGVVLALMTALLGFSWRDWRRTSRELTALQARRRQRREAA